MGTSPISRSVPAGAAARLLLFPLLMLSGCWTGDAFYNTSDLRQPIPAGLYEFTSAENPSPQTVRVEILADGRTQLDAPDASPGVRLAIAPLDPDGHRFVLWDEKGIGEGGHTQYVYDLLEHEPDGDFMIAIPLCDPTAGQTAGARVETFKIGLSECHFRDRASLEAALRQFRFDERHPHIPLFRYHRIDHGPG